MSRMVRFTYVRPNNTVAWAKDAIASEAAEIVSSFNTLNTHLTNGTTTTNTRSESVESDDTTLHVYFAFDNVPETDPADIKSWAFSRLRTLINDEVGDTTVTVGSASVTENKAIKWIQKYRLDNNIALSAVDIVEHTIA